MHKSENTGIKMKTEYYDRLI